MEDETLQVLYETSNVRRKNLIKEISDDILEEVDLTDRVEYPHGFDFQQEFIFENSDKKGIEIFTLIYELKTKLRTAMFNIYWCVHELENKQVDLLDEHIILSELVSIVHHYEVIHIEYIFKILWCPRRKYVLKTLRKNIQLCKKYDKDLMKLYKKISKLKPVEDNTTTRVVCNCNNWIQGIINNRYIQDYKTVGTVEEKQRVLCDLQLRL